MNASVLTLPGIEVRTWQVRHGRDVAANALADRHYSRKRPGSGQVGAAGRKLVLVTPCERALWITYWPYPERAMDGLDAWRCTIFRNEGAGLSSDLIRAAMTLTETMWDERPGDSWVTWVDTRKTPGPNHGYCFKRAGWWLDREWSDPHLIRLRARLSDADTHGTGAA